MGLNEECTDISICVGKNICSIRSLYRKMQILVLIQQFETGISILPVQLRQSVFPVLIKLKNSHIKKNRSERMHGTKIIL